MDTMGRSRTAFVGGYSVDLEVRGREVTASVRSLNIRVTGSELEAMARLADRIDAYEYGRDGKGAHKSTAVKPNSGGRPMRLRSG